MNAQQEMKGHVAGQKDKKLANYTVRAHFECKAGRHAITFFILTHNEKGKQPYQTVHFSDSNTGDAIARAKNWSSLRDLSQSLLGDYNKFLKLGEDSTANQNGFGNKRSRILIAGCFDLFGCPG